ncbi:hypothetical protein [Salinarimonas soli]|uniref:Uncharacterized protein n=1 Tax=Salinarimonas soli TaxID=1638099 RepID=A0A5B2VPF7_9HYPH|nr:hypothetical protein [Salinarimonas soli]KAA2241041.1 hypothetical protein F0L46_05235 [Salinarimonas soli]
MLTPTDLAAPARLQYRAADLSDPPADADWAASQSFGSLREAVQYAMTEEAPAGKEPFIRADSGYVLDPTTLQGLFESLQGP